MKKLIALAAAFAALFTASPALADQPYAVPPSGLTEAYFDMGVTEASDKVANGCFNMGWTMVSSTSTTVICEAKMNTMQSALSQLLIGNSYSTPPKQYIRFNLAGAGRSTRVQATGWVETQMAFGQVRKQEMSSSHYHNNVMALFTAIGGRFPPGTRFPNHTFFGAGFEETGGKGLRITEITPGSPAHEAGLKEGDVVTRLARERIKTGDDLLDGLRKGVKKATYDVEFYRSGSEMEVEVERRYRPVVEAPDLSDLPEVNEPTEPVIAQMPLSAADELAKFAKLRDDGVISEEEFEAMKAKLLSSN
ncbi:SHOCT domain-containing protein [Erythrobacter aureus]|uniref:PDZ domain-containing protein n=1 Tax=Erythrobacter aureus TaxID=2182384 RepID=A0A345YJQ2_9SPHN|nr:PDZ domain-containing protein [Erythrobacter aureus]AXK44154.1 PDZ domain-containing protein [Erythrobacter aureus]